VFVTQTKVSRTSGGSPKFSSAKDYVRVANLQISANTLVMASGSTCVADRRGPIATARPVGELRRAPGGALERETHDLIVSRDQRRPVVALGQIMSTASICLRIRPLEVAVDHRRHLADTRYPGTPRMLVE